MGEGELISFLEALFLRYGYDFRQYSQASMTRRILGLQKHLRAETVSQLEHMIIARADLVPTVVNYLTVTVSELFRDPSFFKAIREQVFPILKTYPSIRIWVAGCGGGEEIYSLAIMLKEEGLFERSIIYATDINPVSLETARLGIYPVDVLQKATKNYQEAGGIEGFSNYYSAGYGGARFDPELRRKVVFSTHNLAIDKAFAEFHLILCRNVMIYFARDLQNRVLELFSDSLVHRGFLGLGSKESLRFLNRCQAFDVIDSRERLFQKRFEETEAFSLFKPFIF